jgi:hypothetical protein
MCKKKCSCGLFKKGYQEKWEAREQQAYALENRGIELAIYRCPDSNVWHLTSKNSADFY